MEPTRRWSEDEVDDDSEEGEDRVAVATKKLKANSSPHVPRRSQKTRSTRTRPPSKGNRCKELLNISHAHRQRLALLTTK